MITKKELIKLITILKDKTKKRYDETHGQFAPNAQNYSLVLAAKHDAYDQVLRLAEQLETPEDYEEQLKINELNKR